MDTSDTKRDISKLVEARHHRAEIIFGVASFAIALALLSQVGNQTTWADGEPWVKQPAFWPLVSIVGMTLFGALELFFSWRRNSTGRGDSIPAEVLFWTRAIEFALWFMAYVWAVPLAGYLPVTVVFCILLTLRLGYRGARPLLWAAVIGAATVVVFKSLLSVKIPGALWYDYLPDGLRNIMILYF
ncbi:MAG: tripartite tricarboxylate transporter TctB family protein [Rhizobiaceae bacterium]